MLDSRRPPYGYSVGLMAEYVAEMANNLVLARAPSSAKLCTLLYGLLAETRLPGATVLLGMTYFSKRVKMLCLARRVERLPVSEADQWHLLVVAIVLGSKFLDDVTYSNTSWAEVSAVPKAELGKLERDWLGAVRWSLFVDLDLDDDYNAWIASWQGWLYTKSFQMTQNVSAAWLPSYTVPAYKPGATEPPLSTWLNKGTGYGVVDTMWPSVSSYPATWFPASVRCPAPLSPSLDFSNATFLPLKDGGPHRDNIGGSGRFTVFV